ncbi:cytochrome c [Celeribacter arenosi]|uniref:Cytochrome c domain-containing protein n=1 Tax=Celeribacter arenosi TaxID=792649 RepID=A0ABP7KGS9_9RHOB
MKSKFLIVGAAVVAGLAGWLTFAQKPQEPVAVVASQNDALVQVSLPDSLSDQEQIGKRAFDAVCAACHGVNAAGRDGVGPPLVHKIYEPSHHGDMSFYLAAENGVRAHHWRFGNMPAQTGLSRADVATIIAYVRAVQRANGIN